MACHGRIFTEPAIAARLRSDGAQRPFFDIDLRLEKEGGAFWLRLTGREAVKQFIKADFSRWFNTDRGSKTAP